MHSEVDACRLQCGHEYKRYTNQSCSAPVSRDTKTQTPCRPFCRSVPAGGGSLSAPSLRPRKSSRMADASATSADCTRSAVWNTRTRGRSGALPRACLEGWVVRHRSIAEPKREVVLGFIANVQLAGAGRPQQPRAACTPSTHSMRWTHESTQNTPPQQGCPAFAVLGAALR